MNKIAITTDDLNQFVEQCIPQIDWAGYLPLMPHGLLGLWSILKLKGNLKADSFHRALARQMDVLRFESIAEQPFKFDIAVNTNFLSLIDKTAPDMANVGHKAVMIRCLKELQDYLYPGSTSKGLLLDLAAWVAEAGSSDIYWHQRAKRRLLDWNSVPPEGSISLKIPALESAARDICDLDMLKMMDVFAAQIKAGATRKDLLAILVLAASEKQMHAKRGLEGKTSWNFLYLSTLTDRLGHHGEAWLQAAAMINFFPSYGNAIGTLIPFNRLQALSETEDSKIFNNLTEAIEDSEIKSALESAIALLQAEGANSLLSLLAEITSKRNSGLDNSHALLAIGAAKDLCPLLPKKVQHALLLSLTKCLANSPQG